MKHTLSWLFTLLLLALPSSSEALDTPKPDTRAVSSDGEVVIARVSRGEFQNSISPEAEGSLKRLLQGIEVRLLSPDAAREFWAQDKAMLTLTHRLDQDHYLIALNDGRGKKFQQWISPLDIPETTKSRVQKALAHQARVVHLLNEAETHNGEARLKMLGDAVMEMGPREFHSIYPEFALEVLRSDLPSVKKPHDQLKAVTSGKERTEIVNKLHFDLGMVLRALPPEAGDETRVETIDKFIADRKLEGEFKQLMVMRKYLVWISSKRFPEALAALEEALAVDPNSNLAGRIPAFQESVKRRMEAPSATPEQQKLEGNPPPIPHAPAASPPASDTPDKP